MNIKKIIGIIVFIAGIALLLISHHITKQIEQGQQQISSGESSVARGKQLFGLNPYSKAIGDAAVVHPAEEKINAGKEEITYYQGIATTAKVGGILFVSAGIIIFLFPFLKKKKKR
ncbi:MAG TPA: hypothetical protein VLE95_01800 [Chlamydiales bacterium]|nr:hypothetical protein [Chlamydiales bacterium]